MSGLTHTVVAVCVVVEGVLLCAAACRGATVSPSSSHVIVCLSCVPRDRTDTDVSVWCCFCTVWCLFALAAVILCGFLLSTMSG